MPQGETVRARLQPAERRRLLLDAAADLFTTRPYAAVSMADVARAAAVSKPLVFRYFGDKRSLFLEALGRVAGQLHEAAVVDPELPAAQRFRAALHGYLDVIERYPHALSERIVARLGVEDPPPRLRHAVRTWLVFVRTSTVEGLVREDLVRDDLVALQIATFRASVAEALGLEVRVGNGADGLRLP
jgi:AcrR family transcriptional regulator